MYLQWFSVGIDVKSSLGNQVDRFQSTEYVYRKVFTALT